MDQWNDHEGGGYFNGNDAVTPSQSSKTATRQQFLCPVTVRQVLEASEEGLKVGLLSATMVSLLGIVTDIEITSTNIKFTLTDDSGSIDCLEWLESEEDFSPLDLQSKATDGALNPEELKKFLIENSVLQKDDGKPKNISNLQENTYYHVYGCIKSPQGRQRIMVFKTVLVKDFNELTAFMLEVLSVNDYSERTKKVSKQSVATRNDYSAYNTYGSSVYDDNRMAFTPVQKAVLDAIKAVGTQVGWSKYDPEIRKMFSAKQIQDALDFLVGEGHIYTTVDDDHFCST